MTLPKFYPNASVAADYCVIAAGFTEVLDTSFRRAGTLDPYRDAATIAKVLASWPREPWTAAAGMMGAPSPGRFQRRLVIEGYLRRASEGVS
jgi:hypothetical protein